MKFRGWISIGLLCMGTAHAANDGEALAQRSVCMACHQVEVKRVGPSFRDIAGRYSANDAAAQYLVESIRNGSRGRWGAIPMPAQRHVDPATALLLSEWILSLAPTQAGRETSAGTDAAADAGGGLGAQNTDSGSQGPDPGKGDKETMND